MYSSIADRLPFAGIGESRVFGMGVDVFVVIAFQNPEDDEADIRRRVTRKLDSQLLQKTEVTTRE